MLINNILKVYVLIAQYEVEDFVPTSHILGVYKTLKSAKKALTNQFNKEISRTNALYKNADVNVDHTNYTISVSGNHFIEKRLKIEESKFFETK